MRSSDVDNGSAQALPDILRLLGQVSTATLTSQLFRRGFRNVFLFGLRPLNPAAARFAGEAFTLRCIPAREDLIAIATSDDWDYPHRKAIETVGEGQVLVVDSRRQAHAGMFGSMIATRIMNRGAAALVTDGAVRDSPTISRMTLPVFAAGVSPTPSVTLHYAVDLQVPIGCAGVAVVPGDILVGDEEGVVVVPRAVGPEIAEAAVEQEEREKFLIQRLRDGAPLRGTYPPNEETLLAYERYREQRQQ